MLARSLVRCCAIRLHDAKGRPNANCPMRARAKSLSMNMQDTAFRTKVSSPDRLDVTPRSRIVARTWRPPAWSRLQAPGRRSHGVKWGGRGRDLIGISSSPPTTYRSQAHECPARGGVGDIAVIGAEVPRGREGDAGSPVCARVQPAQLEDIAASCRKPAPGGRHDPWPRTNRPTLNQALQHAIPPPEEANVRGTPSAAQTGQTRGLQSLGIRSSAVPRSKSMRSASGRRGFPGPVADTRGSTTMHRAPGRSTK